jgi:hypothetical protein
MAVIANANTTSPAHGTYNPTRTGVTIPQLWSGKLLVKFYEASVVPAISNTEYEGEIKSQGDTVKIRTTPSITVRDYTKGVDLTIENPQPAIVTLEISHGKYWAFLDEDVDSHQTDYDHVEDWTRDASEQVKIAVDSGVLADIPADVDSDNAGATAGAISGNVDLGATGAWVEVTKANILDKIVDCGTVLDEQNVPESDRFMVLPAWMCGMIKKSDLQDASLSGDGTSILRNGRIGMIDRFEIYRSNLLDVTADTSGTPASANVTNCLFGHRSALTFAGQFTKNETVRSTATFGDIHRGLKVYGYEVIKPEALGLLYASATENA